MNLIPINVTQNDEQYVSGRDLHMFLEISTRYNDWFKRMCEYGFVESVDYTPITQKRVTAQGNTTKQTNHNLSIEMAKQLCMLARNDKGREARTYFIAVERDWNSPEQVMSRALKIANNVINEQKALIAQQEQQIAEFQPVRDYVDEILSSTSTLTTTQVAADYDLSARALNQILHEAKIQRNVNGQWILYKSEMGKGYTKSETFTFTRNDGRLDSRIQTKWTQKGRLRIHEILTAKGIGAVCKGVM
ncbi:phage antirepressor KilAC domain-containing protein [uncultured Veillonella sp.]|mgnify:FL=1|uniref:phage antirepressor KilAC domain-containing protein n=1 Tax=uncultured Veillonella sp. TaxID=159268 RepID=UPI00262AE6F3|nr:phage antirepressor KilAC domain-containing protein [uncultured Veillonella sp.]